MSSYISEAMRATVLQRASGRCEYCLIPDIAAARSHEVDHIHAEKHGGNATSSNLCLSCYYCNRHKGSDLCSIDAVTGDLSRLFNPRLDQWREHFIVNGTRLNGLSPIGRVTVELFQMNTVERVTERQISIRLGQYP